MEQVTEIVKKVGKFIAIIGAGAMLSCSEGIEKEINSTNTVSQTEMDNWIVFPTGYSEHLVDESYGTCGEDFIEKFIEAVIETEKACAHVVEYFDCLGSEDTDISLKGKEIDGKKVKFLSTGWENNGKFTDIDYRATDKDGKHCGDWVMRKDFYELQN